MVAHVFQVEVAVGVSVAVKQGKTVRTPVLIEALDGARETPLHC